MANVTTSRVKTFDTASGSAQTGIFRIREMQWIDDAGDVIDGDDLSITIDGTTIAIKANIGSDVGRQDNKIWGLGPYNPGLAVNGYTVNTIDHGVVVVVED